MTGCGREYAAGTGVKCGVFGWLCPACAEKLQASLQRAKDLMLDTSHQRDALQANLEKMTSRVEELETDIEHLRTANNKAFGLQVKRAEAAEAKLLDDGPEGFTRSNEQYDAIVQEWEASERRVKALVKYARHKETCRMAGIPFMPPETRTAAIVPGLCTCGLDEALSG